MKNSNSIRNRQNIKSLYESRCADEKQFEYLFNLYVKHQEQLQEVFNIVTVMGIGWLAAECALFNIDIPKWIVSLSCGWAVLNLALELIGIMHFRRRIEDERKHLIQIFDCVYPNAKNEIYHDFFSVPYPIVKLSTILLIIESFVFAVLAIIAMI